MFTGDNLGGVARQLDFEAVTHTPGTTAIGLHTPSSTTLGDTPALSTAESSLGSTVQLSLAQLLGQSHSADNEGETEMATLQLSLSNPNKWNGSEGPEYWRKKPIIEEAIYASIRIKGGLLIAVDQLSTIASYIEPQSGAFKWLEGMREELTEDIKQATKGIFPNCALTPELKLAALKHHAQDASYTSRLERLLQAALPPVAVARASTYVPSKTSGTLVPLPAQVAKGLTDQQLWMKKEYEGHQINLRNEYKAIKARMAVLKAQQVAFNKDQKARAEANAVQDAQQRQALLAQLPAQAVADLTAAQKQELSQAQIDSFRILQEIKQCDSSLVEFDAAATTYTDPRTAESVKAFEHPKTGRLVTPHDAVVLKLFAALDIMYGTADPLTQAKFNHLEQGKGPNVPADESVREFAARIRLHANACIDLQSGAPVTRFFAGLADREIATKAHDMLQFDKSQAQTLDNAADLVQLALHRRLEDLRNRASGGDSKAAEELKKLTAPKGVKLTPYKNVTDTDKAKPKVLADKNHPKSLCTLHPNGFHSNEACNTQAAKRKKQAAETQAAAGTRALVATATTQADTEGTITDLSKRIEQMQFQMAALVTRPGRAAPPPAGVNAAAPAGRCNICGFMPGHPSGKCHYDEPAQAPTWVPGDRSPPHLVEHWRKRRAEAGLPPLQWPRPRRNAPQYPANIAYVQQPETPSAPMLPGTEFYPAGGGFITMPLVAALEPDNACISGPAPMALSAAAVTTDAQACVQLRSYLQKSQAPPTALDTTEIAPNLPSKTVHPNALRSALKPSKEAGPSRTVGNTTPADTAVQAELLLGRDKDMLEQLQQRNSATINGPSKEHNAGGARKCTRFDASDPVADTPTAANAQQSTNLQELIGDDTVVCLDTFINKNPAEGVSLILKDGRLQQFDSLVVDSGATFDILNTLKATNIGLHSNPVQVSLILADTSKIPVKGLSDPVTLCFAKGTVHQRKVDTRFLLVDHTESLFQGILSKRTCKKVGGYVDPARDMFFYRPDSNNIERVHGLPVRTHIPPPQVDINTAAYMQAVAIVKVVMETPEGPREVHSMEEISALVAQSAEAAASAARV